MADELLVACRLVADLDANRDPIEFDADPETFDVTTKIALEHSQDIDTTPAALNLGNLAGGAIGYIVGRNRPGSTGDITIKTATGGTAFCTMKPGQPCLIPISANVTAPFVYTESLTAKFDYVVVLR